jgi:hypothetical protein
MPANAHATGVNYSAIPGAGASLQFDGTNDYVTFGTGNTLAAPNYTVETWFKRTGAGQGVTTDGRYCISDPD